MSQISNHMQRMLEENAPQINNVMNAAEPQKMRFGMNMSNQEIRRIGFELGIGLAIGVFVVTSAWQLFNFFLLMLQDAIAMVKDPITARWAALLVALMFGIICFRGLLGSGFKKVKPTTNVKRLDPR